MTFHSNSVRFSFLVIACSLLPTTSVAAGQVAKSAQSNEGYRIAGTVVSTTDGHPLGSARISLSGVADHQTLQSLVTSEDGKFVFTGLPAGRYRIEGAKRGFISASYNQHDELSTAIVTGTALDTGDLVLQLAPAAIISGRILDESGEPVRRANVALYYDDHSSGVDQIHQMRSALTDDQGAYELTSLAPGTYFLSASAKPWYAVYPDLEAERQPSATQLVDRSLNVAYPVTFYPDVAETENAMPIPVRGGERVQVDIHLNPVPALRLVLRLSDSGKNTLAHPQLQQVAFDGSTPVSSGGDHMVSPGVVEVTGVPAGRYSVRTGGPGATLPINEIDLGKDQQEADTPGSDILGSIRVSVHLAGGLALPSGLAVALRSDRTLSPWQSVNQRGEVELPQLPAGRYSIVLGGTRQPVAIAHISAEGGTVSGHVLTVAAGSSIALSLTLVRGGTEVLGLVKREGKPVPGAMVVLVPNSAEPGPEFFRREESDLSGAFSLRDVFPGAYTVVAVENGWGLDWSQPKVMAAYLKGGQAIEVGNQKGTSITLAEAVQVQSK